MNEPVTWTAVAMAAVANMATWLKIIYDRRNNKVNSYNNKIKITQLESAIETLKKELDTIRAENREDHRLIFEKIERLIEKFI